LFVKIIRKISKRLTDIRKVAITAQLPQISRTGPLQVHNEKDNDKNDAMADHRPVETLLRDELDKAGEEVTRDMREKQREMINSLDLKK